MQEHKHHPKNEFKYCPFCGKHGSFKFDSSKKFKCEKCERSYYMNAAAACTALITTPDGILFIRRKFEPKKGMLDLPGGFIDLGETAEVAIARELKEELNFEQSEKLEIFATSPNDYTFGNMLYMTLDIFFKAYVEDTSSLAAADDALSIEYIKPANINIDEIGFESVKTVVKKYLTTISK